MALYRATALFVNRIMTNRIPAKAFVANTKNDGADPSGPDISAVVDGLAFRDLIDPGSPPTTVPSFTMPTALRPPAEGFAADTSPAQPTVRVVVDLGMVGMLMGAGLKGGPLYMNRNFEFDLPVGDNYAGQIGRVLVINGLATTAGSLTNAQIPAALNTRWASVPVRDIDPPAANFHDPNGPSPTAYRLAAVKIARFSAAGPVSGTLEGGRPGDQIIVKTDAGQTTVSVDNSGAWTAALAASVFAEATLAGGAIGPDRLPIKARSYPGA